MSAPQLGAHSIKACLEKASKKTYRVEYSFKMVRQNKKVNSLAFAKNLANLFKQNKKKLYRIKNSFKIYIYWFLLTSLKAVLPRQRVVSCLFHIVLSIRGSLKKKT